MALLGRWYWGGSRSDPFSKFSRLETRVRILFFIPAVRRMVAASRIRGQHRTRTALAHAVVFVRASACEACANGRGRGLGGAPQERLPLHGRRGPRRPSTLRLGRAAFDAVMPCRLMAAWLARCGPVAVQRAARSHATVSVSPIREEFSR